jgi:hypothetical protein
MTGAPVILLLLLLAAPLGAQERVTVFTNVTVIPMDRERALEDQTVVVRGDRIADVGRAAAIRAPRIAGVMVRGVWLSRAELDRRLSEIKVAWGN